MLGFDVLGDLALAEVSPPLLVSPPHIFNPPALVAQKAQTTLVARNAQPALKGEVEA